MKNTHGEVNGFLRIWLHLLKKSLMGNFIFREINHLIENFKKTEQIDKFHDAQHIRDHRQILPLILCEITQIN